MTLLIALELRISCNVAAQVTLSEETVVRLAHVRTVVDVAANTGTATESYKVTLWAKTRTNKNLILMMQFSQKNKVVATFANAPLDTMVGIASSSMILKIASWIAKMG